MAFSPWYYLFHNKFVHIKISLSPALLHSALYSQVCFYTSTKFSRRLLRTYWVSDTLIYVYKHTYCGVISFKNLQLSERGKGKISLVKIDIFTDLWEHITDWIESESKKQGQIKNQTSWWWKPNYVCADYQG
jgi:hypothetical protein